MNEREKKSGGAGCFMAGVVLIAVPVLYVLGIGPAAHMAHRFPIMYNLIHAIYEPVRFLGQHCEPIRRTTAWYLELWGY